MRAVLDARARFGAEPMRNVSCSPNGTWTVRSGPLRLRWTGAGEARFEETGRLRQELCLEPNSRHDLVLEISDQPLGPPVDAGSAWQATAQAWQAAIPPLDSTIAVRDGRHAYTVLRGLTSQTGGMVAAATMSLPERAGAGTNYDYRYVWLRDQCYAGLAVAADGPHPLLATAVDFVTARLLADGDELKPAYLLTGGPVPDEEQLDLPGYPGGADVRGNHVRTQFQLDALGESLQLLAAAARHDLVDANGWRVAQVAAAVIIGHWDVPDAGIWELDDQWWTHSRLSCVAGLRQAAAVALRPDAEHMHELAHVISTETARHCGAHGYWQRNAFDERVGAALLLTAVRDPSGARDPRFAATLDAVRRGLMDDGYVYRYAQEGKPLGEAEGAILLCGFALALAEAWQGSRVAAFRWFECNRAACGPPGLLAEEFDVEQRQLRGNLPQAFVHALLLEAAVRLAGRVRIAQ